MTRALLLCIFGALLSAGAVAADLGASVQVCNKSGKHGLAVAAVYHDASLQLQRQLSWTGKGYWSVAPGRCVAIFEDAKPGMPIWLRITSNGRFIPGSDGAAGISAGKVSFCVDPADNFEWARTDQRSASSECAAGSGPGRFSYYLNGANGASTTLSITVDPDPVMGAPVDVVAVSKPAAATNYPKSRPDERWGMVAGISMSLRGKLRETGLPATGLRGDLTLLCTYGLNDDQRHEYGFWAKEIDKNVITRLHAIDANNELARLGTRPVPECPAMEREAIKLQERNVADWSALR